MSRPEDAPGPQSPLHEQLRHRRQAHGLDLEALSRETRIQRRYFEAIELGQFHLLPQGVYMRNFIRIYLRAIGMDNPAELQSTIDTLTAGVLRLPMVSSLPPASRRQQDPVQARASALVFAAAMLLAAAGWLLWRYVIPTRPGPAEGTLASGSVTPVPAQQSPAPVLPTVPVPPSPTPGSTGVGVTLHAVRKASVVLKGRSGSETPMTLQKDESVQVYLGEPTVLEISSAGAVELTILGRRVPMSLLRSSRTVAIDPADVSPLFEGEAETIDAPTPPRARPTRTPTEGGEAADLGSEGDEGKARATPTVKARKATPTVRDDEDADEDDPAEPTATRKSRKTTTTEEPAGERVYPKRTPRGGDDR